MKNNSLSGHTGFDTETNRGDPRLTASQLEFEALVIPLLSSLYSTALRMRYVQEQAEELVRTTLFEAFRHFDQYQKDTSFRTWIFAILVNLYAKVNKKNIQKAKKKLNGVAEEFLLYKKIDGYFSLRETDKEDFLNNIDEKDVKQALRNLPDQFRLFVHLCDIEGLSCIEIAKIIGLPLRTVISQLYQGRKLLQKYLWNQTKKNGYHDGYRVSALINSNQKEDKNEHP